jgi:hypothetical protein
MACTVEMPSSGRTMKLLFGLFRPDRSVVPRMSSNEKFWRLMLFARPTTEMRRSLSKMLTLPPPMYLSAMP